MEKIIVFVDCEINQDDCISDMGAVAVKADTDSTLLKLHTKSQAEFAAFISKASFICGHNIFNHDLKYIENFVPKAAKIIDTLYLSPLLFPKKPYHKLLKDDKFRAEELNNPLNDSLKAMELFWDEVNAFNALDEDLKRVYFTLLGEQSEFSGFFDFLDYRAFPKAKTFFKLPNLPNRADKSITAKGFEGKICSNAPLSSIVKNNPIELAFCLSLILTDDRFSITPPWVNMNFPLVGNVIHLMRNTPCKSGCEYCNNRLNIARKLKDIFGYETFRKYDGEPLQESAAKAAVDNKSLLAIFPTGGGKSITFQLPALIAGETVKGLTVVISPLQSLMKDQVDNLANLGIADAAAINGMLSPLERAENIQRIESGKVSILYISPESLRSQTIEKLLLSRNIVRFVIDEAHCFSAWGQEFRVDYLYIAEFIKTFQKKKNCSFNIPVSCFTATAKPKVISDIRDYFKMSLDIDLELFATSASRKNLRYQVIYKESDDEKYTALRNILSGKNCPVIVYVSSTNRTRVYAEKLCNDGFTARAFNGKMDSTEKIANQEAFMSGEVQIIVATSAFGMGVDKSDVGLVVHFDISDSLENYVQEAGRAGRDPKLQADCYVLFNDTDLDRHFILLNQTKLSISEINQVWRAIKSLAHHRKKFCRSALEIAREAGWESTDKEIETRVRTAITALETAGYVRRGQNSPHVFATSIQVKSVAEANQIIRSSDRFEGEKTKTYAERIISSLISSRSVAAGINSGEKVESRIDYMSERLGIEKADVISVVTGLREIGLLSDCQDLTAYLRNSDTKNKSSNMLKKFASLERFLIEFLAEQCRTVDESVILELKSINEKAEKAGVKNSTVKSIRTILYYWNIKCYIKRGKKTASGNGIEITLQSSVQDIATEAAVRADVAEMVIMELYSRLQQPISPVSTGRLVQFSAPELLEKFKLKYSANYEIRQIEDALLYLSKIDALTLEGGFLVLYNSMEIEQIEHDNRIQYKKDDYKQLDEYYKNKIQQIHIVGEYANMMMRDYNSALRFVADYFTMEYKIFLKKYFAENDKMSQLDRNITSARWQKLFGNLSDNQKAIIDDKESPCIVVTAGPGSGKTRTLVHKLAALYQLDDVKHEQFLMLTFTRAAVTEFKKRLFDLIGGAAYRIEIKTFHSYCFDLLGKIGNIENSSNVVKSAVEAIRNDGVESERITKTVVVIDEAQDMDEHEYELIRALMARNDNMKLIAVGDDDQNIYEFRGSSNRYLKALANNAKIYQLNDNYRSSPKIVEFANAFAATITQRLKSTPIRSVIEDGGVVKLLKYKSNNLEIPVLNLIKSAEHNGSVCVLTNTNDEALRVTCLLTNSGISARLIQSNDKFRLSDLVEFRVFMKFINERATTPTVCDELWNDARKKLETYYSKGKCFEMCRKLLDTFESIYPQKYKSDLELFIAESKIEDFAVTTGEQDGHITVSTVHKSKGREFDRVYLLLNNVSLRSDGDKRKVYVGLTRAKNELYVLCNNGIFDNFQVEPAYDSTNYPEPSEIILQQHSHRDVWLDKSKDKKRLIIDLYKSGNTQLIVRGNSLYSPFAKCEVAHFSKKFAAEADKLVQRGYSAARAEIRHVLAWSCDDYDEEIAVILADVWLERKKFQKTPSKIKETVDITKKLW
ncbi:MAG: RecQ family ATP-dependent DNA helicase [Oscillospiraceae bacterium]|nr:RecQ family ATP-dependent DNA helicase [Oscillospiraceae bacterium]